MKNSSARVESSGLALAEDAVALLRSLPLFTLLCHFIGALPFVVGLLYFIADMMLDAYAAQSIVAASLWLALLFIWMKCWHSVFMLRLLDHLGHCVPPAWTVRRIIRLAFTQAALQPWGLLVRPASLVLTFPYPWVKTYYENLLIAGDGEPHRLRALDQQARQQALLWTKQNWELLGALTLLVFFVWLNLLIAIFAIPTLLKTFFGWETDFTRSIESLVNTTTFAASFAATYLCTNPIWKAACAIRWFRGESIRSGADLRAELGRLRPVVMTILCAACFACSDSQTRAAEANPAPIVSSTKLNQSVEKTLAQREFAWRLPRTETAARDGWLTGFYDGIGRQISKIWHRVTDWIGKWLQRLIRDQMRKTATKDNSAADNHSLAIRIIVISLTTLIALALGYFLWRQFRQKPIAIRAVAEAASAMPDLSSENVMADELPEDGWLQLARELQASGQYRFALRALYLSALAHLGTRQLITIARHKSNRDYERELLRRARQQPELGQVFSGSRAVFEASWYGHHEVTHDLLGHFRTEVERMRAC